MRALARLWRPVDQKVSILIDFAANLKHIGAAFVKLADGSLQGPVWAVELFSTAARLSELFQPDTDSFHADALYDATYAFSDAVEKHMYLADKQLRETASELYNLSNVLLGSLSHD